MARLTTAVMVASILVLACGTAGASLLGTYYNLEIGHPDMQDYITGWTPGMVENILSGPRPTLTAYGHTQVNQFDWWDAQYEAFSRLDSEQDLQSNFNNDWFPVQGNLPGDPYHFAVHWEGQFYVDENKSYEYSMGSDDDSWLFIDGELVLDLGGVHAITYDQYTIDLTEGHHDIDIFFAERHTVDSAFQLNFFTDFESEPPPVPEPSTMLLLARGRTCVPAGRISHDIAAALALAAVLLPFDISAKPVFLGVDEADARLESHDPLSSWTLVRRFRS